MTEIVFSLICGMATENETFILFYFIWGGGGGGGFLVILIQIYEFVPGLLYLPLSKN